MTTKYMVRNGTLADVPDIVRLLNSAYRGESSRLGWTTEADLIGGNVRTNEEDVSSVMNKPGSVFLLLITSPQSVVGCVNLQRLDDSVYLGMFAVAPASQGGGLGRKLMDEAEAWALSNGRSKLRMWVISVRSELIGWYERMGFRDTGERKEFKEDGISGPHLRPLDFMVLEKEIAGIRR